MSKIEVKKASSFSGHRDSIYALQPGHGDIFYSAAGDGFIVQWKLQKPDEGKLIARLPNSVYALLYLPKQNQLIAAQNTSGIHLLDPITKKEIASLELTKSSIFDLKLFDDYLFVATADGELIVVELDQWRIKDRLKLSEKSIRCIAVNSLTNEIAVGSSDFKIRVYDTQHFQMKNEFEAHQNSVFALTYSPDNRFLISGSRDAHIKVWDSVLNYTRSKDIAAHLFAINDIKFSPDGKYFATCSMDKSIKVWNASNWQLLKVIDKSRHAGHGTSVNKLLWMPDSSILLSASDDRSISAWDLLFL